MKKLILLFLIAAFVNTFGQSIYDDNETSNPQFTKLWSGGNYVRGVNNPSAAGLNISSKVSRHTRSAEQYDGIVFNAKSAALDAGPYVAVSGIKKKMTIDFYSAYPGTEVLISLSNSVKATADYPTGRHSEYNATTTKTNAWERLTFNIIYQPDPSVSPFEVDQFVLLIDPGKYNSKDRIYYFDNFRGPDYIVSEPYDFLYEDADSIRRLNYVPGAGMQT